MTLALIVLSDLSPHPVTPASHILKPRLFHLGNGKIRATWQAPRGAHSRCSLRGASHPLSSLCRQRRERSGLRCSNTRPAVSSTKLSFLSQPWEHFPSDLASSCPSGLSHLHCFSLSLFILMALANFPTVSPEPSQTPPPWPHCLKPPSPSPRPSPCRHTESTQLQIHFPEPRSACSRLLHQARPHCPLGRESQPHSESPWPYGMTGTAPGTKLALN